MRSAVALPNGMPLLGERFATVSRRSNRHWRLAGIVLLLLTLSGCSTTPPVIPDCPAPPEPVEPPAHLTTDLPRPYRHSDAESTSSAQLLVCARNYQEIMRPALRRLQDWREWAQ